MVITHRNKDYIKALKKIDRLINRAKKERDSKGYRENLGYDSQGELENFMNTLKLSYGEKAQLIKLFYEYCDEI